MKLPHPDRAVVDVAKLADYCLDPRHEYGKHKARVFASALGLSRTEAGFLRERLLAAASGDAELVSNTKYGVLYVIDFELRTSQGEATLRSGWIVRITEDFPRLTTCFVKRNS